MNKLKSVITHAIKNDSTLITKHYYSDVIKEPLTLEVYPYILDGDFLVCYDLIADQPYAINLNNVITMDHGKKKDFVIPERYRL